MRAAQPRQMDPALAATLKLQEADVARQHSEMLLKQVPAELASIAKTVASEKEAFEAKRKAFQELEVQRKDADNRLKLAEAKVMKFKTQQIDVRKNDEYQALSHEIETAEAEISALETEEITLMMTIDEAAAALREAEAALKKRLADLDGQAALIRAKEAQCQASLAAQTGAAEAAATHVPAVWKRAYDSAKSRAKRPPFLAPIEDHRCGGCHLRVSNEVAEAARHGGKPVVCDSCGRIAYWPA